MKIGFYRGDRLEIFSNGLDENKVETLLTTGEPVECGLVFTFNGKTYCVCSVNRSRDFANVEEIKIDAGKDKDFEDEITCPYCGYACSDSYEYSESEDDHKCGQCGGVFSYESYVEISYSSKPVKAPEIKSF